MITSSYKNRKKVVTVALCAIILLTVLWFGQTYTLANSLTSLEQEYNERLIETTNTIGTGMFKRVELIFIGSDDTSGDSERVDWAVSMMTRNQLKDAKEKTELKIIDIATKIFQGLGMVLVTYYCIKKMIMDLQRENGTSIDVWFQMGAKMIIGFLVVLNFEYLLNGLEEIGTLVIRAVRGGLDLTIDDTINIQTWLKEKLAPVDPETYVPAGGLFASLGDFFKRITVKFAMFKLTAVMILMQLPLLVGDIALYTILIEILLRKMAAPLALADVVGEGARSNGLIYLKKFFALYLRVAMCLAVAFIGSHFINAIAGGDTVNLSQGLLKLAAMIIMYLTIAKLYTQTQNIANNVMGV